MKNKIIYLIIASSLICARSYSQNTKAIGSSGEKPQHVIVDNTGAKQAVPVTVENTKPMQVSVENAKPVPVSLEKAVPLNVKVENIVPVSIQNTTPISVTVANPTTTPIAKQPYPFSAAGSDANAIDIKTGPNEYRVIEYICGSDGLISVVCGGYNVSTNQRVMIVITPNSNYRITGTVSNRTFIVNGMIYPQ